MSQNLYSKADEMFHLATQLLSLTAINLVEPKQDDSHTTSVWNENEKALLGRPFSTNSGLMRLGLDIPQFCLFTQLENGSKTTTFDLDGRRVKDLKIWIKSIIKNLGLKQSIIDTIHYDLPAGFLDDERKFNKPPKDATDLWMAKRSQANAIFATLNTRFKEASEVNIWPHHFDTGVYYPIQTAGATATSAVGAGMAIADTVSAEAYFYIYGWKKDSAIDFSTVPPLPMGSWKTAEGWQGAILPIFTQGINDEQIGLFFKKALGFFKPQLLD